MTKCEITDIDDSLEYLVRSEPIITYSQSVLPVFSFFWNGIIFRKIHPLALPFLYIAAGVVLYTFQLNRMVRVFVLVACALPIIGCALFLVSGTYMFVNSRHPAFKSAQDILLNRIETKRAQRKKGAYDLFLPPPNITGKKKTKVGMIVFPGALVNHTSYAPIASELSDLGILVVVLSLEPTRFVADIEANKKMALEAMYDVLSMSDVIVDEWVLAGHSAGAKTAINLVTEMKPDISKLLLFGVGGNELSNGKTLRDTSVQALVINGSEDNLVNGISEKERETFRMSLPPTDISGSKGKTTFITIEGGNHAGFGHYGPQKLDGIRTIPLEEQQRIFVENSVDFLLAVTDGKTKEE